MTHGSVAVLGAGIQGACVALELARRGFRVDVYERLADPLMAASLHNEGKIHLGLVYARDAGRRTVDTMLRGAVGFEAALGRWIDVSPEAVRRSRPFLYLVHARSGLDEAALGEHFRSVARRFDAICAATGQAYFGTRTCRIERWSDARCAQHFDPAEIVAAFETPEISLRTEDVAAQLRAALDTSPRVQVHTLCAVERVSSETDGSLAVHYATAGKSHASRHLHVVNACWAGRLAIDETMGVRPEGRWSFRYKLGLFAEGVPAGEEIPSCTMVSGPFGDIVSFGGGDLYLSWYPDCMLEMAHGITPPPWGEEITAEAEAGSVRRSLEALSRICPGLAPLCEDPVGRVRARGGVIYARGATDIQDPESELHERHRIGVRSFGAYHTIDTGKYTTAPLFALEVCDRLVDRESRAARAGAPWPR